MQDQQQARTRRLSYGAIERSANDQQTATITLLHEHQSVEQLLQDASEHRRQQFWTERRRHLDREFYGAAGPELKRRSGGFAHFRLVVGALIIGAVTMNTYANYTIYIAAIEMISNDVLQSGMTELRARHLSADPLAGNRNAATPGTCPMEAAHWNALPLQSGFKRVSGEEAPVLNASQLSTIERLAMQLDAAALLTSVHERLASGQLVDWSISQRGYIFTAHNLGGILWAVPISRLGLIYGSKLMIFLCTLVTGLRMLLLPHLAGHSPFWATLLFELLLGGPGACIAILAYPMAAVWLLPDEANFFVAISPLFGLIGTAGTNLISTQLLAQQINWPWCYYLPGIILCLIASLWLVLGADRPSESRFVSRQELELLAHSVANRNERKLLEVEQPDENNNNNNNNGDYFQLPNECLCAPHQRHLCPANRLRRKPNWRAIFTCPTVWALIAVFFSYHWNAKVATLWPTYFANMLHLDPSQIGLITGFKGLVALVFGSAFAFATRKLVVQRPFNMSLTAYRRINQALATLVLGASVALMVALDCDFWANFASVLLTPLVTGFNAISHEQMPLDLSAEDSGLLVSVIRLLSFGDILALPASSYILSFAPDALAGDRSTWRLVWLLGFALKVITCLLFVAVAKSKPKSYSRLEPAGVCKAATSSGDGQTM